MPPNDTLYPYMQKACFLMACLALLKMKIIGKSHVTTKSVFGVSDQVQQVQVRHKPGCTTTVDGQRLEIFGFRKKRHCNTYVAKAKELTSCTVCAQLICAFVAYMQKAGVLMTRLILMCIFESYTYISEGGMNQNKF